MHVTLSISARRFPVRPDWIAHVLQKAARVCRLRKSASVAVALVGTARMRQLHARYSKDDRVTDVLSFPAKETHGLPGKQKARWPSSAQDGSFLGDMVLCVPYIVRRARQLQISVQEECARVAVHGLLHLLGYDHARDSDAQKMYTLQDKLVYTILHRKERKKR